VASAERLKKHLRAQRLVALLFLGLILSAIYGGNQSKVAAALVHGQRIPVLLFGIDAADMSRHTDTLMIAALDPMYHMINVLSVPRDTRVDIPGYRFRRVNEIYGYQLRTTHDPDVAARKVIEGLEYTLSSASAPLHIPYFIQVDFGGFRRVIDLLGGVWVRVKEPMNYDDHAGNVHIHYEPGLYLLKGADALRYCRFRGPTGDRGRIYRQQEFMRGMVRRLANPFMLFRYPSVVAAAMSGVRTNLTFWDIVFMSLEARHLRPRDIGFYILPGTTSGPYWRLKTESAQRLAASVVLGADAEKGMPTVIVPQSERITVNVWNASGRAGMAYSVTKFLRRKGYDVMDWGNYATEQIPTRVIDRRGKIFNAQSVANDMGVENFHSEPNANSLVDVEVVVGSQFNPSDVQALAD
jgi:LCP family protein required for cell wall assembly